MEKLKKPEVYKLITTLMNAYELIFISILVIVTAVWYWSLNPVSSGS